MAGRAARERVTLADVAEAAGVTKGTVSKVLNGRSDVAADTRARVLATATELGYRPTTSQWEPPRTRTLAAVIDVLDSPYISNVLQGILDAATASHTNLLVRLAPDRAVRATRAAARAWVAEQQEAGVVGIIGLTLGEPTAVLRAATEVGVPFVMVDPVDLDDPTVVSIGSTNWAGGRTATEHLLALGHRRIGWIGGPQTSAAARERLHGYRAAMGSAGVEPDPELVRGDWFSVESGLAHGRELLTLPHPPTAIVAGDDEIAVGVLEAARQLGVAVPAQLSVVGFDDTPQAMWTTPRLTSVHQPLAGMGRMAVETVLAMAAGVEPASRHVELATSLTVRDSTGPVGEA
ncbi:LacI family DNA-binding transcriptional regulator [Cellulomonas chengniuliangii]|uniref:LacI family transcriptional regulator n=1 Tax=Cellulomonas chengniuliangii TaxID=2968084 RepID=A0ABY5KWQ7_9CELL|nr:LacI family DNA-binding transcriptional regulator [Cellulomonas chengniuliangii]MCC2309516.1 LacI family transcriptional regulator [Cellulomonas chengniuliangii]UUI74926.1 LacI family transcriptional regulator [Cellulomonas chengniuliangii]